MLHKLDPKYGVNEITSSERFRQMQLESSLVRLNAFDQTVYYSDNLEQLVLLQQGKIKVTIENNDHILERSNVFDDAPEGVHFPKGVKVTLSVMEDSEFLIVQVKNMRTFDSLVFNKSNIDKVQRGAGLWNDAACREVRTICDYSKNSQSMLAFGETINYPGRWSGYIPHMHHQPELYFYRFYHKQGFGVSFYGEETYKVTDYCYLPIEEPITHPQVAAPGYPMYYFWIIRHFEDDPWIKPIDIEEHTWLLDPLVKIWPEK